MNSECPACGKPRLVYEPFLRGPIHWYCTACGAEWEHKPSGGLRDRDDTVQLAPLDLDDEGIRREGDVE